MCVSRYIKGSCERCVDSVCQKSIESVLDVEVVARVWVGCGCGGVWVGGWVGGCGCGWGFTKGAGMAVMRNNKHKARLAPHATLFRLRESERMLADDLLENVSVGQWM